jgi:hypothetical protein
MKWRDFIMTVNFDNSKYIKDKIKDAFGELEVYNPQHNPSILEELMSMISNNSIPVELENGETDIRVDNVIKIMRFMLANLTNINPDYWDTIDDTQLKETLDLADGDFKKVVNSLLEILMELGNDIVIENMRKLKVLKNKLNEMIDSARVKEQLEKTLSDFGLDNETLMKVKNGDEEVVKAFQKKVLEQEQKSESKRGRPRKQKN